MQNYRRNLERIKQIARAELEANIGLFKNAIIRELTYLQKANQFENLDELKAALRRAFNVPPGERRILNDIVNEYQQQIQGIWDEYFKKLGISYENIKVMQKIDFGELRQDHLNAVILQLDKAIQKGFDYKEFRAKLLASSIGTHYATTLANTAIAQFDNAYMHEVCEQAGIERFLYDGMPPQRQFCKEHWGNIYTKEEILQLNNGQGLPVITNLGGYNCVHFWTPVIE